MHCWESEEAATPQRVAPCGRNARGVGGCRRFALRCRQAAPPYTLANISFCSGLVSSFFKDVNKKI